MKNVRMSRLDRLLRGWNKQFFSLSSPRICRRGAFGDLPLCKRLTRTNNRFPSPAGRTLAGRQTLGAANTSYAVARGFTLIELLVVVLIIGILASVAVPQYTKAVEKSRAVQAITLVKSVRDAAEVYRMANGSYPKSLDSLIISIPKNLGNFVWDEGQFSRGRFALNHTKQPSYSIISSGIDREGVGINATSLQGLLYCYSNTNDGIELCSSLGSRPITDTGWSGEFWVIE